MATQTSFPQASSFMYGQDNNLSPVPTNPTSVQQSTKSFGDGADKFMIEPFITPFPYQQQKRENTDLVSGFSQAIGAQETMPQLQQRYENRYFIPELREAMQTGREAYQGVVNQIRDIPRTISETTRESLVTAGQAAKMAQADYQKLAPVAQALGQTVESVGQMLTDAERNMSTSIQMEIAQQKKELMPFEQAFNLQTIMQAREFTGWTQAHSMELQRLMANQQAGYNWTNAEAQRAHDLEMLKERYSQELNLINKQNEIALQYWG